MCDDTKTAVAYLDLVKAEVKARRTVHVRPAPHGGADGLSLISFAETLRPSANEREDGDDVWVLIDLDTNQNLEALHSAANTNGVLLALSKPCFEIWTLAHLQDTGEAFENCDTVLQRAKAKWKEAFNQEFPKKAQADYSKIMPMRGEAILRCRRRRPELNPSWTGVHLVIEAMIA